MPPRCILLDIEGTTSSISFVYDVMFPYVRENLASFLAEHWESPAVVDCLPMLAADVGQSNVGKWLGSNATESQRIVADSVIGQMDADIKATGLKRLQGEIWKSGFESGQLVSHVYDDVLPALEEWLAAGSEIRIYSSGSIQAQLLFFGHTIVGDLLPKFSGHYDTTIGSKKSADSYHAIASDSGIAASEFLFVSDVLEELHAAGQAGMQGVLSVRPGNKLVSDDHDFETVTSFAEIDLPGVSN